MRYITKQHVNKRENTSCSVLYLEIDYELMTLYDAMEAENEQEIAESKSKLTQLVEELYTELVM